MAVNNKLQNTINLAYSPKGFNSIFPRPIVALRAPLASDKANPGQLWVQPTDTAKNPVNSAWILTSIINNSSNWLLIEAGGGAGMFASLTVTPGPINLAGITNINTVGAAATTIGNATSGATIIGPSTVTGSLTQTGGTLSLSGDAIAGLVNIGTGAAAKSITIGNITGATFVDINAGSGGATIATTNSAFTVTTGTGAVNLGVTATDHASTLGSVTGASATTINGGTSGITLTAPFVALPGPVYIYTGAGVPANGLALHTGDMYINTTAATTTTRLYIATGAGAWTFFTANA